MDVQSLADQLFFVTVRIEATANGSSWVGTGFLYAVETSAGAVHFLVTNKHVYENATEIRVAMNRSTPGAMPALGEVTEITVTPFGDHFWRGHPDEHVDVAAMAFGPVLNEMQKIGGVMPFFRSVGPPVCLNAENVSQLDAIEEVIFIGYPRGIYDTRNLLPVARTGTTATPLAIDYEGLPAFLVDASVFPGSSGSPVFLLDRGGTFVPRGENSVQVGGRFMCLGVLAAVHVHQVQGDVVNLPARLVATYDEPLDLGIVFKATTIDACVDPILEAAGLTRVAAPPEEGAPVEMTEADRVVEKELEADQDEAAATDRAK